MNGDRIRYHIFRILPSTAIILAALPIYFSFSKSGDYCNIGMLAIIIAFYILGFIFVCLCVLTFHLYEYFKKYKPFNFYPLFAITFTIIYYLFFIESRPKKFIEESDLILFNYTGDVDENYLYLTNKGEYLFIAGYIEATCYDFGNYKIYGDTLEFDEAYIGFSDTMLYQKYILDVKNNWYRPMTDSCSEDKFLRFKK